MPHGDIKSRERRKYIRLGSVFPVQFRLVSLDKKSFLSGWVQGFTSDVSEGGICLSVNNLNPEFVKLLEDGKANLDLDIEMPVSKSPVAAHASIIWVEAQAGSNKYFIGLRYEQIDTQHANKIIRFAITKRIFLPALLSIIFLLGLCFAITGSINLKLIKGNKALVEQLLKVTQEFGLAKQKMKAIGKERLALESKIKQLQQQIYTAQDEKVKIEAKAEAAMNHDSERVEALNKAIEELNKQKGALAGQLVSVQEQENDVSQELLRLDKKKVILEKANFDKMYQWLKLHQNLRTGLVMSFEGDDNLANWAFIYDQSLVAQAYTFFSDFERAQKIFDFFSKKAERKGLGFFNAYYSSDGSPAEYVVHSGPNIWLGIAVMQYTRKTKDYRYIELAKDIAREIMDLQNQSSDGGISGGPDTLWFSTEHNLDAYAFFNMLYKVCGQKEYLDVANKILNWLLKHTYDRPEIPIKRGKGDSTIATDTYAWSIAAIGPAQLEKIGMNPEKIMEFAEQNCAVRVSYARPDGRTILVKGFDFAAQKNLSRGGVVSTEWTAQMVMAFKIMADFYNKKGDVAKSSIYAAKAEEYLAELSNMVISSPSPSGQGQSCLPYCTQDSADTGHGWSTPKGKSTGSVAGTAYTIFAYYGYNPLELKE